MHSIDNKQRNQHQESPDGRIMPLSWNDQLRQGIYLIRHAALASSRRFRLMTGLGVVVMIGILVLANLIYRPGSDPTIFYMDTALSKDKSTALVDGLPSNYDAPPLVLLKKNELTPTRTRSITIPGRDAYKSKRGNGRAAGSVTRAKSKAHGPHAKKTAKRKAGAATSAQSKKPPRIKPIPTGNSLSFSFWQLPLFSLSPLLKTVTTGHRATIFDESHISL